LSSAKQSASWNLQLRQLLLPKLGQEASECEDVIAVDTQTCRFAVADGATEAFDARNWAERLAQHWVQNESNLTPEDFRKWVAAEGRELQDSWSGLNLSWYAEEKARAAILLKRPTKAIEDSVVEGRVVMMGLPWAIPLEGGVPLIKDGQHVGAIGVSGVQSFQDGIVARAGLAVL